MVSHFRKEDNDDGHYPQVIEKVIESEGFLGVRCGGGVGNVTSRVVEK